ncbi:MAG: hypothetical protein Q9195_006038 [Heterodermia aff. obscurata]
MEKMPLELLLDVMKLLPKKDKKSLRRTSKPLSVVATPLLFDSVYLSHNSADLVKAESTLKSHASSINTIVLSPMYHRFMNKIDYRRCVKRESDMTGRSPYRWRFEDHIDMGYEAIMDLQGHAISIQVTEIFEPIFRAILRDSPNLRKIVISDRKRYAALEVAKFCRWKDCAIPAEMHDIFELTPMQCARHTLDYTLHVRRKPSPWMLNAISTSSSKLRDLVVEHERTGWSLIGDTMQSFLSFTEVLPAEAGLMSNLTTLKLSVDNRRANDEYDRRRVETAFGTRIVAKNLACAKNLERLSLTIVNCRIQNHFSLSPSMFHYLLSGCRFPKLRMFVLNGCAMEGKEIVDFLDGSPKLAHLVLRLCYLKGYSWAKLAEYIKANMNLIALSLEHLLGPTWDGVEDDTGFLDCDGLVEKFLLHGGPNPLVYDSSEDSQKIWREPTISDIMKVERKVEWYHEKYF